VTRISSRPLIKDHLDLRTVAEIQRNLVKWSKRNAVSRRFRAGRDNETIAGWRSGLEKMLQVLNVRSAARVVTVANSALQKALATTTDAAIPAIRHDATNTHTIVSGVQNDVVNTPAIFSDSHRNALKSPGDTCGRNLTVGIILTLSVAGQPLKINRSHARSAISTGNGTCI
jgi:hypothetical protein